jgi:hypothetical protein
MAEATDNSSQQNSSGNTTNTFLKGMSKDYNDTFVGEGVWTHARNAVNNSHDGQLGTFGNEPSNFSCVDLPYTLIGAINTDVNKWVVFTTNNVDSEIGEFDDLNCTYKTIVNAPCLNFKTTNLITGATRARYDCGIQIYWDDSLNPTRTMNLDNIPWVQNCTVVAGCQTCVDTTILDCEKLRIAPFVTRPCVNIERGKLPGTLANGSYQAFIAYTVNQVKVTDYVGISEVQGLFTHENTSSSLELTISNLDADFDEFELVILSTVNAQTTAKRIGYYNTSRGVIYVDRIDPEYETVPVSDVVFRSEPVEKSDAMYSAGNYLLRTGVYSKFKFNYQPLANQITVNWVAVEYPYDYYVKGNNNAGYMRDEQYAFFIRFVYNTGEFSESYHIPGRPPLPFDTQLVSGSPDYFDGPIQRWKVENTYSVTSITPVTRPDGGVEIARGGMGYWESTEYYPSNRPDLWDSFPNIPGHPLNLCGKPIRHHKMPDETQDNFHLSNHNPGGSKIRILGVEFNNISFPVDNNGNPITAVVGYEILRGSREGNKTILAKGLINNMREYKIPGRENDVNYRGLFQNYPYNDLRPDSYLTSNKQISLEGSHGVANVTDSNSPKLDLYKKNIFSFHSPDVSFTNPYLNPYELKVYQEQWGKSYGSFQNPYKHPKFKVLTDFSDILSKVVGLLQAINLLVSAVAGADLRIDTQGSSDIPLSTSLVVPHRQDAISGIFSPPTPGYLGTTGVPGADTAASGERAASNSAISLANAFNITFLSVIQIATVSEQVVKLIAAFAPKLQYSAQYNSHGFYNQSSGSRLNNRRRKIDDSAYISPTLQQFTSNYQVNNINRSRYVIVKLGGDIDNPLNQDNSRFIISEKSATLTTVYESNISSYYASMKIPMASQYGQLENIKQIPIVTVDQNGVCVPTITPNKVFRTGVLFGGDIYVNRFTEKNTMFFFSNWLMGEPDLIDYNYTNYINIPYPRYWINNQDSHSFFSVASDYRALDYRDSSTFFVKRGYFYLFNSGVRDFFVESEVNVAYRDWEDDIPKRHYDPDRFNDLSAMFRSDIIQSGNFYKYDYSLSLSKLYTSSITWGNTLPRDYDPLVAESCYTYEPTTVRYSLPIQDDTPKRDGWTLFLTNNRKDFLSPVSSIKSINKTGAVFMMKNLSPLQFMGVEELKLDGTGAKVTIGDGKLFESGENQLQSLVNTEDPFEYASNQSRYSAVNTTHGLFWVSQSTGKVFNYTGSGMEEISKNGMRWWFAQYLPSYILKQYPTYALYDNPVIGIGTQMTFDVTNEILYITKKDYRPKYTKAQGLTLDADAVTFKFNGTPVQLTNTQYFEDASWTISYDPKLKVWLSFHDWKPSFAMPGRTHFMTVAKAPGAIKDTVWKHNESCTSFCNFYGVNHPFEIEFVSSTGQTVNTVRSVEYILEAYKTFNDCRDKMYILDANFDQSIIYNNEQISGVLELNLKTKNNPLTMLGYPQITTNSIRIQYSKEENKYRFNQFWDITNNRGEYTPSNVPMFNVQANGYIYNINPAYVNYNKASLQRKKFRHYSNRVFLRKVVSGDTKFLFKISNQKNLQSYR